MNPHKHDPAALEEHASPQDAPKGGRNGSPPDGPEPEADLKDLSYEPVPPQKTTTVSVRYRVRGRGQPLPYPLDQGDGE